MGQRLQVYIHTHNPLIAFEKKFKNTPQKYWIDNPEERKDTEKQIQKYRKALGTGNTIILCYHNQWCYGKSSLLCCSQVLQFNKNCTSEYSNPFSENYVSNSDPDVHVSFVTHLLSLFTNPLAKEIGRYGMESFHFLNYSDPQMRLDYSLGDNNDGIIIIDTLSNRYAFMNIGGDSTVNQLPLFEPVSAKEYLLAYYPENLTDHFQEMNNDKTEEEIMSLLENNKANNVVFLQLLDEFSVLTKKEIAKMFPERKEIN